jgi:hypothetical protein
MQVYMKLRGDARGRPISVVVRSLNSTGLALGAAL